MGTRYARAEARSLERLSEAAPHGHGESLPAWLEGYKALTYAEQYLSQCGHGRDDREEVTETRAPSITTVEEALTYFSREAGGDQPEWVGLMNLYAPGPLRDYGILRKLALRDALVPRKMKELELVLVGVNLSERYPNGVSLHVTGARRLGATDAELADVALACVLTAGIPAWFELSDLLIADQECK